MFFRNPFKFDSFPFLIMKGKKKISFELFYEDGDFSKILIKERSSNELMSSYCVTGYRENPFPYLWIKRAIIRCRDFFDMLDPSVSADELIYDLEDLAFLNDKGRIEKCKLFELVRGMPLKKAPGIINKFLPVKSISEIIDQFNKNKHDYDIFKKILGNITSEVMQETLHKYGELDIKNEPFNYSHCSYFERGGIFMYTDKSAFSRVSISIYPFLDSLDFAVTLYHELIHDIIYSKKTRFSISKNSLESCIDFAAVDYMHSHPEELNQCKKLQKELQDKAVNEYPDKFWSTYDGDYSHLIPH